MPATTPKTRGRSDAQLKELLGLLRGADSVELKLTVPEAAHRSTVTALGMDPLDAEIRQVFFFDTPELALNHQGVVVRARRIQRRDDDSVVKLRPVVPDRLSSDLRSSKNLVVEVDAMPGGFVCSAALKRPVGRTDIQEVAAGTKSIHKLYSKEQRRFFAANTTGGIELDDLSILGPITILKLRFRPKDLGRRMVAELWHYPDGSQILELSTKCAPAEAFQVAAESRAYLAGRGVDLSGDQQTKTRTALEYFSSRMSDGATA
ncbi:MAG TPA: hypothetical protein VK875_06575 [Euzebyales bacterium]|nr:hypothetical protein [Euzebyales bacterium]